MTSSTRTMIVGICLLAGWLYLADTQRAEAVPVHPPLSGAPMVIGSWVGHLEPKLDDQIVAILGVDDYLMRGYSSPSQRPVGLYVGYYSSQRQGDTIHSPLNCLPGAGWEPLEQSRIYIPVKGAFGRNDALTPIEVNRVIIGKGLDRELVLYWYQSHQRIVASEYWG